MLYDLKNLSEGCDKEEVLDKCASMYECMRTVAERAEKGEMNVKRKRTKSELHEYLLMQEFDPQKIINGFTEGLEKIKAGRSDFPIYKY